MGYAVFLVSAFFFPVFLLFFLKKIPAGFYRLYLSGLLASLIIPLPQIERLLLSLLAGFEGTFVSLLARSYAELVVIVFVLRISGSSEDQPLLLPALLSGWAFGMGKLVRDILLVLFHPLHRFYGYSQFASFLTPLFVIRGILEAQVEMAAFGLLALWLHSKKQKGRTRSSLSLIAALCIKTLHALILSLAQSTPQGVLVSILYTSSILPLLSVLGYATLFVSYRKAKGASTN
ncbi:hypothetical protein QBE54_02570 [Thermatribacter velox]|uniref:YhfC family intramembrane metalloprotease n=1 Tax=Thermatribacter velox TaxID=3039681 RepID=A0ABZ2YDF0_9BACT